MATTTGAAITARALKNEGVDTFFYLYGGPIQEIIKECYALGI